MAPVGPMEQQRGTPDTPLAPLPVALFVLLIFTLTQVLQHCIWSQCPGSKAGIPCTYKMPQGETTHHQSDRVRAQIRQSMQTGASLLASQLCIHWSSLMNRLWQTEPCQRHEPIIEGEYWEMWRPPPDWITTGLDFKLMPGAYASMFLFFICY